MILFGSYVAVEGETGEHVQIEGGEKTLMRNWDVEEVMTLPPLPLPGPNGLPPQRFYRQRVTFVYEQGGSV
jgi:hypothetical protein